ncbi:M1 family metallopeptidase [Flavobacterium sp. NKUCC04_CG]|uniref:M1 family metallopeptidase n=1 Tax=Flavobacterium sp. NKUCC04_CG TaxID=2842121 RepID=UPI001C5AB88C|nr:M1 family metallopeptidase [Flavobacterium sp. NKUCC04_CG]MBW3518836.1 M1 family metallopeptidase [Flavobacterium sp. NKUCC04_CG]
MKKFFLSLSFSLAFLGALAQKNPNPGYWQQHVDYKMEVNMDIKKSQYAGIQKLTYTNHSPDTLNRVFFHLFYNAFQPGSDMDARLKSIADPDKRMVNTIEKGNKKVYESKISLLKPDEIGYLKVKNLKQDGVELKSTVVGTVLEVTLKQPILPGASTVFTMNFDGQAPKMIRRAGRNSAEGVALSMAQWFPKMAEYDFEGWHVEQYLGREFHSVWGDFDVKLTLDKNYTVGATGNLENKNEIGHGYQDDNITVNHPKNTKNLTWHFTAKNVLDFTWAADDNYIHDKYPGPNGLTLHFLYKNNPKIIDNWKLLQSRTAALFEFYNRTVGLYPYDQYSVIQGGDGGMEYSMCTLITGNRDFASLVGVTAHEMAHSWFQHTLATNETKHEWMDEGFTSFISDLAVMTVMDKTEQEDTNPFGNSYKNYYYMVNKGIEQPLTTHADRFDLNSAYSISAYVKGSVFLTQLSYIIGMENTMKTIKQYYKDYQFTHPTPNDFKRTAERVSGAVLDWYMVDWTQTTNTIDYGIEFVEDAGASKTKVSLQRIGRTPMPLDIMVEYEDGSFESFYIPNTSMHWIKPNPYPEIKRTVLTGWGWGNPHYEFTIDQPRKKIKTIIIDPSQFMADIDQKNNVYKA